MLDVKFGCACTGKLGTFLDISDLGIKGKTPHFNFITHLEKELHLVIGQESHSQTQIYSHSLDFPLKE